MHLIGYSLSFKYISSIRYKRRLNLRAWQQIRFNDTLDLTGKLVDSLEKHFELKGDGAT